MSSHQKRDNMNHWISSAAVCAMLLCLSGICAAEAPPASSAGTRQPVDYVDPLIDSANGRWFFFASACRPFGMVNLNPDMVAKAWWDSGYQYDEPTICGFNHVHAWQLSGPSVMPVTGEVQLQKGSDFCRSRYSHDAEIVEVGYHAVTLDDYQVRVELTSTDRVGLHRLTFPHSKNRAVLFNLGSGTGPSPISAAWIKAVGDRRVEGAVTAGPTPRRPKPCVIYFSAEFDVPFKSLSAWTDGVEHANVRSASGKDCKVLVHFAADAQRVLQLKVALSYVSTEQARLNLETELPHWDFEKVRAESRQVWNDWLSKIEVEGGTEAERIKFYTDLWHVLLGRRMNSDVNGKYCDRTGPEPVVRQIPLTPQGTPKYHHYNSDAFWNTFWNINQVWGLAYPEVTSSFVGCMLDMYRDGGLIPRGPSGNNYTWVMIASHSTPFITAAYMKGIRDFDILAAYAGMRKNAMPGGAMAHGHYEHNSAESGGLEAYLQHGYIPADVPLKGWYTESAAGTLEYAYDDWCLAEMARELGKTDDVKLFAKRAANYRNLFDAGTGFMRPRNKDRSWLTPFDPLAEKQGKLRVWCEGTAYQYTFFVPHDVAGLIELMGGRDAFNQKLNTAFERSVDDEFRTQYVNYGNQPSIQMAHLFNYSGAPWLAQKWVRAVKSKTFGGISPENGYRGDEDQGQAGGLCVMMAIGLFQTRGGAAREPVYEITSPLFDRITVHLNPRYYPGGTFTITTRNNSPENVYIQSALLHGKPLTRPWFTHRELIQGGTLELQLGPKPNRSWGDAPEDAPPSMSDETEHTNN